MLVVSGLARNRISLKFQFICRSGDKYSSYFEISVSQHDVLRDLAIHLSNDGDVNQRKRLIMPRREAGVPKDWERNADKPFNARVISLHTGRLPSVFSLKKIYTTFLNYTNRLKAPEYSWPWFTVYIIKVTGPKQKQFNNLTV